MSDRPDSDDHKNQNGGTHSPRRVLVTGANGFLGRHVARQFALKGCLVIGIGHGTWDRPEWEQWGLSQWHRADITLATLHEHGANPSTIIHCAGGGSVAFSQSHPLGDFRSTVETTAHVLEYIRSTAPSCRLVYPSSASVYGTVKELPIQETYAPAPISQYGVHKLIAEQLIASYARQFGVAAAIVRLFSVYGPGLRKQLLWDACERFSRGGNTFMGTGEEVRDWLHVDDAAELMYVADEHADTGCSIVNGGRGEGPTVSEVIHHLAAQLDNTALPVFSGTMRSGDPVRFVASIEAAALWGWKALRPWTEGVAEYADWWKKNRT